MLHKNNNITVKGSYRDGAAIKSNDLSNGVLAQKKKKKKKEASLPAVVGVLALHL